MAFGLPNEVLYLLAGAIVVVVVLVSLWQWERRRTEAFGLAARQAGWSPQEPPLAVPEGVREFHLFRQGHAQRVLSAFTQRSMSFETTLLEYRYTTGGGKNSSTHRQTVLVAHGDGLSLPALELRPESIFHRIGSAFGFQDIDLESRPEFSRAYLLRGEDEGAIRALFADAGIVHHFEKNRGWSIEAGGPWIVVYRHGKRAKPDELREFVREAERIASVLAGR
jgi:hypothetical protein